MMTLYTSPSRGRLSSKLLLVLALLCTAVPIAAQSPTSKARKEKQALLRGLLGGDGSVAGPAPLCDDCAGAELSCGGGPVVGSLSEESCDLGDGSPVVFHPLALTEQTDLRIELSSESFDTLMALLDVNCETSFSNDDCIDGGSGSCLSVDLEPGTYFVGVTVSGDAAFGDYVLSIDCEADVLDLCSDCVVGSIECGQTLEGDLSPEDCPFGDGTMADMYSLELAADSQVSIEMASMPIDTFLVVFDASCEVINQNDDCMGEDLDLSCLTLDLEAGTYFLAANSFDAGETGDYTLTVSACEGGGGSGSQRPGDCNQDGRLDLSDGICLLNVLFGGGTPSCDGQESFRGLMNVNGDTTLDLSDAVSIFSFLFLGGPAPVPGLDCVELPGCSELCVM